jgi:hypothetical protein
MRSDVQRRAMFAAMGKDKEAAPRGISAKHAVKYKKGMKGPVIKRKGKTSLGDIRYNPELARQQELSTKLDQMKMTVGRLFGKKYLADSMTATPKMKFGAR